MAVGGFTLRKLVGLIVLIGALVLGNYLFSRISSGPVPVEIHYQLGSPPVASALEVDFRRAGDRDVEAHFDTRLIAPDVKESTRLRPGVHSLDITLVDAQGQPHHVTRSIDVQRNAVIQVDLSREAR